jgi:hypothetical protein
MNVSIDKKTVRCRTVTFDVAKNSVPRSVLWASCPKN